MKILWSALLHRATIMSTMLTSMIHTRYFDGSRPIIDIWRQKEQSNTYPVLTLIAQDLVCALYSRH